METCPTRPTRASPSLVLRDVLDPLGAGAVADMLPLHWRCSSQVHNSIMTSLTIFLPLPKAALFPNARVHWRVRWRETKLARRLACEAAKAALVKEWPPRWPSASLHVKFTLPGQLRHDPANLMRSLKAYEDGLQDAGIIENDRGLWPERPVIDRDPALKGHLLPAFRRGIVKMVVVPEKGGVEE